MVVEALVSGLVGAAIGGSLSFFAQRWYFKQSLKKQVIEEVYFPLLEYMQSSVERSIHNLQDASLKTWAEMRESSKHRWIPEKLRTKLAEFFGLEVHNYNVSIAACNNIIYEFTGKFLVQKSGNNTILHNFPNFTQQNFANIVLRRDTEHGGYVGDLPPILEFSWNFSRLKEDANLEFENTEQFIDYISNEVKDHTVIKETKQKQIELIGKIKELENEIENQTKL